jgi:hypothetical protein
MRARARLNLDFDITKHNTLDLHLSAFARRSSVATKGLPKKTTASSTNAVVTMAAFQAKDKLIAAAQR